MVTEIAKTMPQAAKLSSGLAMRATNAAAITSSDVMMSQLSANGSHVPMTVLGVSGGPASVVLTLAERLPRWPGGSVAHHLGHVPAVLLTHDGDVRVPGRLVLRAAAREAVDDEVLEGDVGHAVNAVPRAWRHPHEVAWHEVPLEARVRPYLEASLALE